MVRFSVEDGAAELLSSLLWDAGTSGIVEIDGELLAGFDDRATAEEVAGRAAGWPAVVLGVGPSTWSGTDELTTVTVGSEASGAPTPTRSLSIVAGPTFGHGHHPTTALAIGLVGELVERRRSNHRSVSMLDVGTGSGVLAVVGAALGAQPVVGIDVDPDAVVVARANAERNGVEVTVDAVPVGATPSLADRPAFDLVVANVLLPVQRELAPAIAAVLAPEGSLITTGYLRADGSELIELHRTAIERTGAGAVVVAVERERDGWLGHRFDLADGS